MRKLAVLSAATLLSIGAMATDYAEARSRRNTGAVIAAGVAGLAIGGLIGAAASNAYARPAHGPTDTHPAATGTVTAMTTRQ